jgi:uncharacterized protein YlbG (UPF0298 family)
MKINQELAAHHLTPRQSLIVFLKQIRDQYKLRRFGDIVYFSKKMHYCILYVNKEQVSQVIKEINNLNFVKAVKKSDADEINLDADHIQKQIEEMAQKAENQLLKQQGRGANE